MKAFFMGPSLLRKLALADDVVGPFDDLAVGQEEHPDHVIQARALRRNQRVVPLVEHDRGLPFRLLQRPFHPTSRVSVARGRPWHDGTAFARNGGSHAESPSGIVDWNTAPGHAGLR